MLAMTMGFDKNDREEDDDAAAEEAAGASLLTKKKHNSRMHSSFQVISIGFAVILSMDLLLELSKITRHVGASFNIVFRGVDVARTEDRFGVGDTASAPISVKEECDLIR
jgi:hypothetical protein